MSREMKEEQREMQKLFEAMSCRIGNISAGLST